MKRIVLMLGISAIVCFTGGTAAFARRADKQPFAIERYKKVILAKGRVYMSDGQGVAAPFRGALLAGVLSTPSEIEQFPAYSGVYVEDIPEPGGDIRPVGNQFQFCWDIAAGNMMSLNVINEWLGGVLQFTLMDIPLHWLTASSAVREIDLPDAYAVSGIFPLFNFFLISPNELRSRVFFDVIALDERAFTLYIAYEGRMTVREFDRTINDRLITLWKNSQWQSLSHDERRHMEEAEWKATDSFPIDFEGPFWVIAIGEQRYLLSEVKDTLYRIDEQGLTPVLHLPAQTDDEAQTHAHRVFIVDKDRQQLSFVIPSLAESASPTVITIGGTTTMPQGLEPALRSMLERYGKEKK